MPAGVHPGQPTQPGDRQYSLAISYIELRTGRLPFEKSRSWPCSRPHAGRVDLTLLPDVERAVIKKVPAAIPPAATRRRSPWSAICGRPFTANWQISQIEMGPRPPATRRTDHAGERPGGVPARWGCADAGLGDTGELPGQSKTEGRARARPSTSRRPPHSFRPSRPRASQEESAGSSRRRGR